MKARAEDKGWEVSLGVEREFKEPQTNFNNANVFGFETAVSLGSCWAAVPPGSLKVRRNIARKVIECTDVVLFKLCGEGPFLFVCLFFNLHSIVSPCFREM